MALRLIAYRHLCHKWTSTSSTAADSIRTGRMPFHWRRSCAVHFPTLAARMTAGAVVVMTEIRRIRSAVTVM